jgi:hypothetical protein
MDQNMSQPTAASPSGEAHREVSTAGKFVGLIIIGSTVLYIMYLEKFGPIEYLVHVKWMLLGALVAGVGIPMLLFRRKVQ